MVACTDRRLGIHASVLLVVYGERRSTLFHGDVHDVVSSRTPYLHATQWGAHDVWSHPVRRAVFPRPHDPRDPMRVSMMSGLAVSPRDLTIHATPRGCPMMSGLAPWSSGISQAP